MWKKVREFVSGNAGGGGSSGGQALPRRFRDMVTPSGRVSYDRLRERALELNENEFVAFVRAPVLAGASVHPGSISRMETPPGRRRKGTLLFRPADFLRGGAEAETEEQPLQQALYALMKSSTSAFTDLNAFVVGRVTGNDLVMPDFAISEHHARIEYRQDMYRIFDLQSTNGTTVNGQTIGSQSHVLNDGDVVTFARYEFTFLLPSSLYQLFHSEKETA